MQNRLVLFSSLLILLLFHPALGDENAVMQKIGKLIKANSSDHCKWTPFVTCDSGVVKTVNLTGQNLKGPLPDLSNLANLTTVYLDHNDFNDVPTGSLSGLTALQSFNIDNNLNLLTWDVFRGLTGSKQLVTFSANSANLTGPIPDMIGSFPNLKNLHLAYNKIQGPLPASLGGSNIQSLWLNNQDPRMQGTIEVIGSMPSATTLWLHVNNFSGPIPDGLSKFKGDLRLSNNYLQGPMPSFANVTEIAAGTSSFCNYTPGSSCVPQVTTLLQIVSLFDYPLRFASSWKWNDPCNDTQQWDGITCSEKVITEIDFSNRNLSGNIDSPVFANLTSLTKLTLGNNSLTGPIPESLAKLPHLVYLDVSNNNMSGKVPAFHTTVTVNTSGNPFIGTDLSGNSGAKKGLSPWATTVVVILVIIMTAVVGFCAYRRCSKKDLEAYEKTNQQPDSEVNTTNANGGSQQLSSHASINISGGTSTIHMDMGLLIQVTDDFSEAKIIGRGGFGTVYRGKLPTGTEVAVKRMVSPVFMSSKGMAEYKAEIEVLSKVNHKNLVGLIGFCENKDERLLVYEFMPQGTLGDHLFDWRQRGGRPLTWSQRAVIALDVARGVDYLHTHLGESFIHRDLKPNNILLGDDMRAKVADFGLVKNAGSATESIQTKVAGTFGYFAPEYWETGRVTTKVDVYAFGVILMEIISGRKVVDDSEDAIDGGNLMLRFRRILAGKEDVRGHIDPTLHADEDEETYRKICEVVELAGHCTVSDPSKRCNMGYAARVLNPKQQWTQSNSDVPTTFSVDPDLQLPNLVEQWKAGIGMPSASYTYA